VNAAENQTTPIAQEIRQARKNQALGEDLN